MRLLLSRYVTHFSWRLARRGSAAREHGNMPDVPSLSGRLFGPYPFPKNHPTLPPQGDLFGYILDLTGGVTASLMSFVFPALAYLRATDGVLVYGCSDGHTQAYRRAARVLIVFGGVVMALVPVAVALCALGY